MASRVSLKDRIAMARSRRKQRTRSTAPPDSVKPAPSSTDKGVAGIRDLTRKLREGSKSQSSSGPVHETIHEWSVNVNVKMLERINAGVTDKFWEHAVGSWQVEPF